MGLCIFALVLGLRIPQSWQIPGVWMPVLCLVVLGALPPVAFVSPGIGELTFSVPGIVLPALVPHHAVTCPEPRPLWAFPLSSHPDSWLLLLLVQFSRAQQWGSA
jgi:hypothetical protein